MISGSNILIPDTRIIFRGTGYNNSIIIDTVRLVCLIPMRFRFVF